MALGDTEDPNRFLITRERTRVKRLFTGLGNYSSVEHLPGEREALCPIPSTTKKQNKKPPKQNGICGSLLMVE
jgi:hypothetical protein